MSAVRTWLQTRRPRVSTLRRSALAKLSLALDRFLRSPVFLRSLRRAQRLTFGLYALQTRAAARGLYAWSSALSGREPAI